MLADKLNRLVDAYEGHGLAVRANLAPGVTNDELDAAAQRYGFELPEELRALYRWRNGHLDPASPNLLCFGDEIFAPLGDSDPELTVEIYRESQVTDGAGADPVDLGACVPFAGSNGSALVVPGGGCGRSSLSECPVVIVFEGIRVAYLSIEAMIDTCIDWVEQSDWEQYDAPPNEAVILNRHNPGLVDGADDAPSVRLITFDPSEAAFLLTSSADGEGAYRVHPEVAAEFEAGGCDTVDISWSELRALPTVVIEALIDPESYLPDPTIKVARVDPDSAGGYLSIHHTHRRELQHQQWLDPDRIRQLAELGFEPRPTAPPHPEVYVLGRSDVPAADRSELSMDEIVSLLRRHGTV